MRLFAIVLISTLCLANWSNRSVLADSLAEDEAAISTHIKALHDEDNATREAAAKALRLIISKYPSGTSHIRSDDSGKAYWMEKVDRVTPGITKAKVIKILPPFPGFPDLLENGSGQSHVVQYRIDPHWIVIIHYRNPDKVIERPALRRRELLVNVVPPMNYTGRWACWYVNGQKGHDAGYKDGKYNGVNTHFHDNGGKSVEQHYANHVAHGAATGWYPDGRVSYRGQYKNGEQDGKWTHWYPNGKKKSEAHYKEGKKNGPHINWRENGRKSYEVNYKHDLRHGIEASWNEQGAVQYKRNYKNGELVE